MDYGQSAKNRAADPHTPIWRHTSDSMRAFRTRIYRVRDINRARIYACMYLFRASPRGHLERVHSIVHLDTVHSIVHMDRVSLPGCFCTGLFARISRPRFITRAQGMHAYYQTCTPRVHSGETCSMWTLERGAIFWGQLQMDYGEHEVVAPRYSWCCSIVHYGAQGLAARASRVIIRALANNNRAHTYAYV